MELNQLYFYTATINSWRPLIKEFELEPIIIQSLEYLSLKKCINVYGFVVMPNHIHLIWELKELNGKESPAASFMKFTSHQFKIVLKQKQSSLLHPYKVEWQSRDYNFWQTKPDWFLLDRVDTIQQKLNYIHLNPMRGKWSLVSDPNDYYYSSCSFYEKEEKRFNFLLDYRDRID